MNQINLEVGELLEFQETKTNKGFILIDDQLRHHYFYFTSDGRHVKYDGHSSRFDTDAGADDGRS